MVILKCHKTNSKIETQHTSLNSKLNVCYLITKPFPVASASPTVTIPDDNNKDKHKKIKKRKGMICPNLFLNYRREKREHYH